MELQLLQLALLAFATFVVGRGFEVLGLPALVGEIVVRYPNLRTSVT